MQNQNESIILCSATNDSFKCKASTYSYYLWKGQDIYLSKGKRRKVFLYSFLKNKEDKLLLSKKEQVHTLPLSNSTLIINGNNLIELKGVAYDKVKEWVEIATGTGRYAEYNKEILLKKQEDNPIQIK